MSPAAATLMRCLLAGLLAAPACRAEVIERTRHIDLAPAGITAGSAPLHLVLTEVRDDMQRHPPFALLLHGRPVTAADHARMGRVRYPAAADWLARRGYAVLVPTRAGYGLSGGPDLEYAGECDDKRTAGAVAAAAAEMRALLQALGRDPDLDVAHGVAIGESFGGLVALALADGRVPGVRAAVNFSGGDGGDWRRPGQPCQPLRLQQLFADLGGAARRPTLWLYSRNDLFWGSAWPARWWDAWQGAGGQGHLTWLPAHGANGHFAFSHDALHWQPPVAEFLAHAGLP